MKAWKITGLATLAYAALLIGGSLRAPAVAQAPPEWRTDYQAALIEAREKGRPIFAVIR